MGLGELELVSEGEDLVRECVQLLHARCRWLHQRWVYEACMRMR